MPNPALDQIKTWAENYTKLWNVGDKEAWSYNCKKVATNPVGTREQIKFDHAFFDS